MNTLRVQVEGIGLWSSHLANFTALQDVLAGRTTIPPSSRPPAVRLPANERRRAPESVLLAIEVAGQAVAMSDHDDATLACVFASAHGDQTITDYMCETLAATPAELSPTRFHNSVHNAPVGYWTIATDCNAPSTAIAAQRASFGAGLLEAATQVLADQRPVLLVCSDIAGTGPLREVTGTTHAFGSALILAPVASTATVVTLDLTLTAPRPSDLLPQPLAAWRSGNASAEGLPLLALLAQGGGSCQLAAATTLGLRIDVKPAA